MTSQVQPKKEKRRTISQNAALHLYFRLVAEALNEAGLDMRAVLKPEVEIPWSPKTVKEYMWKPILKIQLQKRSTTEMTTTDIDKIYDTMNRHLGEKTGLFIPFPSAEGLMEKLEAEEKQHNYDQRQN